MPTRAEMPSTLFAGLSRSENDRAVLQKSRLALASSRMTAVTHIPRCSLLFSILLRTSIGERTRSGTSDQPGTNVEAAAVRAAHRAPWRVDRSTRARSRRARVVSRVRRTASTRGVDPSSGRYGIGGLAVLVASAWDIAKVLRLAATRCSMDAVS